MENIIVACDYRELNKYTQVFNLASLQGSIWLSIPKYISLMRLFEIHDLSNKQSREVNFYGKIEQDFDHPWLQIPLEILDLKSGKHTYKLVFLNEKENEFRSIFFSYISQDDNPETPYIYMEGRGNSSHEANQWKDGSYSDEYFDYMRKEIENKYGYDPFSYSGYDKSDYCARCTSYNCSTCPYNK